MRPVVLITGASSGLGATFARVLAQSGFDLVLVARRREKLEALAAELETNGIKAEVLVADLASDTGLAAVEERVAADDIYMLINNAGFGSLGRFWEASRESQDRMHRVHIMAAMRLTHAALGGMAKCDRGAIINVSSVSGFIQTPDHVSYAATKAWMNAFTECIALEVRKAGAHVKIQCLCPGFTYTEFHDTLGVSRKAVPEWLWMQAEEVVAASLAALRTGDLFVVPGWPYKAIVALFGILPRPAKHALVLSQRAQYRRPLAK